MNDLQGAFNRLLRGEVRTGDDLALLMLFAASLLSLAHLLTMIVTRWGDRHTAIKSLVASLLVHCVCFFSFQVLAPLLSVADSGEPERTPVETELIIDVLPPDTNPDPAKNTTPDGTPLVDRPNALSPEMERLEKPAPERDASVMPERESGRQGPLTTAASSISQFEARDMQDIEAPRETNPAPAAPVATDPATDLQTIFEASRADLSTSASPRIASQPVEATARMERAEPSGPVEAPELDFRTLPLSPSVAVVPAASGEAAMLALPTDSEADFSELTLRPSATTLPELAATAPSTTAAATTNQPDARILPGIRARLPRPSRPAPERAAVAPPARFRGPGEIGIQAAGQDKPSPLPNPSVSPSGLTRDALVSAEATMDNSTELQFQVRQSPSAVYQLRGAGRRSAAAKEFGGTEQSEQAVERSLRWLASVQSPDGRWDASDYGSGLVEKDETGTNREFAGREADTGVTGLAVLCFLGAGYTHEQGPYTPVVDRALDWLLRQQAPDGNLFGRAEPFAQMYCHAIATYAIAEACALLRPTPPGPLLPVESVAGMLNGSRLQAIALNPGPAIPALTAALADGLDRDVALRLSWGLRRVTEERLRRGLAAAVRFIIARQDQNSGGWRYQPRQEGDVSMLGWQLMALKSAELGGLATPPRVRSGIQAFLTRAAQGSAGGLYGYRPPQTRGTQNSEPVTPAMTAEALFCRQMLGMRPDTPAVREAVDYLEKQLPAVAEMNFYYWYYGSLALHQYGGPEWQAWNERTRELLIASQLTAGPLAGSWDPTDLWSRYGGRLYSTTLATLTLEVYYRLLPLQRLGANTSENASGNLQRPRLPEAPTAGQ